MRFAGGGAGVAADGRRGVALLRIRCGRLPGSGLACCTNNHYEKRGRTTTALQQEHE